MGISQPDIFADLYSNFAESGRWQMTLIIVAYVLVVYFTNRFLITTPACYNLFEEVDRERVELGFSELVGQGIAPVKGSLWHRATHRGRAQRDPSASQSPSAESGESPPTGAPGSRDAVAGALEIGFLLDRAALGVGKQGGRGWKVRYLTTLARVVIGRRYLHSAQQLRASYSSKAIQQIRISLSDAAIILIRLERIDSPESRRLHVAIDDQLKSFEKSRESVQDSVEGLRVLMAYARKIVDDAEDSLLERAAEDQRRVLWLVLVGLVVIFVFGITGHREILLYGALGGILAPLTTRWQYRADDQPEKLRTRADADAEYVKSWGVLLLGPVAGALAAYGGLLLLSFLSDPEFSVLGEIFQSNSWSEPSTTIALALALLFGYSGGLFGKIALSASNQVLPSSASSTPAQATPPTEGHVEEPQGGAPAPVPQSMPFEGDTRHESTTATAGLAVPSNDGAKSERDHPAGRSTLASLADLAGTVVNAMGDPPSAERQANDSDATPQEDGGAEFEVTAADTEGEHNADQGPSDAAPDGVEASSGGEGSDPRS